ncbi:MAG: PEGA domain-containing protein [Polyangiaceae bacterium]
MIRAFTGVFLLCSVAGLAACGEARSPRPPTVSLRMQGTPVDAIVIIDEELVGQLDFIALRGVALPPGVHHVTVKAVGYFPMDKEVTAKVGDPPIRLDVALMPVPD